MRSFSVVSLENSCHISNKFLKQRELWSSNETMRITLFAVPQADLIKLLTSHTTKLTEPDNVDGAVSWILNE
jgi:hypothetical protein